MSAGGAFEATNLFLLELVALGCVHHTADEVPTLLLYIWDSLGTSSRNLGKAAGNKWVTVTFTRRLPTRGLELTSTSNARGR